MGLAELEVNLGTFDRSAEADAVNFEVFGVALADADEHVGDQTLRGAMKGAHMAVFGLTGDVDDLGICIDFDA